MPDPSRYPIDPDPNVYYLPLDLDAPTCEHCGTPIDDDAPEALCAECWRITCAEQMAESLYDLYR